MPVRKIRSTFRRSRGQSDRHTNTAALARRSFNQNVRHFKELHDPKRHRDADEIARMRAAAAKNPSGNAARLLMELGLDEQGRKAPPRRKKA